MSITSITYMVLIHISCILHATQCTHVWPNQHAHLSIVQYAIMCTCICEKYIQAMLNTYCWSGFVSLPILFLFHECEGVGATSYKKWPVLIIIQLSHPLTRYFVRPKKPETYETEYPHLERMRNANYASLRHFAFPYEYEMSSLLLRLGKKRR